MNLNKILIPLFLFILLFSLNVAANTIKFHDHYTIGASTSSDAITWGGTEIDTYWDNPASGAMVVCWDWENDGEWDDCIANNEDDLIMCICDSSWLWDYFWYGDMGFNYGSGHMSAYYEVQEYYPGYAGSKSVKARYYTNCGEGYNVINVPNSPASYKIINRREYDCNSIGGTYKDEAYYGSGWWILSSAISCSSGYGCDENKDDSQSNFGSLGISIPSAPCSKLDGQSCSSNNDCLNHHCSCKGICAPTKCGDGCCESGEWCTSDPCSNCGGYPPFCNTCSSTQCASTWWYERGASKYCFDHSNLCCSGDPVFGQYYCKTNEDWALCTNNNGEHHTCEQQGNYYCTYENSNWAWRICQYGCNTNTKICNLPPQPTASNISVSPTYLNFSIGV